MARIAHKTTYVHGAGELELYLYTTKFNIDQKGCSYFIVLNI